MPAPPARRPRRTPECALAPHRCLTGETWVRNRARDRLPSQVEVLVPPPRLGTTPGVPGGSSRRQGIDPRSADLAATGGRRSCPAASLPRRPASRPVWHCRGGRGRLLV